MVLLLLALLLLAPHPTAPAATDGPHPALAALTSRGDWKLLEPPRTFGADTLYEEIDGEAELFLPYGMERLTVAIVGRASAPGSEVRLELYRMASPRDAYGIWSQHRFPDQELLPLPPSEVVVSDTSADFFRGETFARVRAKPGERSRKEVVDLVSDIVTLLPGSGSPPEETRVLDGQPERVPGTVIYQKRSMLGYECLAPGFEARLSPPPARGRLLLLPPGGERLPRLARELPGFREISAALYRADLPSGPLWISPAGNCIVGVTGADLPRGEAERFLSTLAAGAKDVCAPSP